MIGTLFIDKSISCIGIDNIILLCTFACVVVFKGSCACRLEQSATCPNVVGCAISGAVAMVVVLVGA